MAPWLRLCRTVWRSQVSRLPRPLHATPLVSWRLPNDVDTGLLRVPYAFAHGQQGRDLAQAMPGPEIATRAYSAQAHTHTLSFLRYGRHAQQHFSSAQRCITNPILSCMRARQGCHTSARSCVVEDCPRTQHTIATSMFGNFVWSGRLPRSSEYPWDMHVQQDHAMSRR